MVSVVDIASYLPSIKEPEKEQSLKEMLMWTGIVLFIYFLLGSINVWGADSASVANALTRLETFQTLLGSQIGTLITLGIGPIVTASIVLQMLVGSELLPWDTNTQEGKQKFQASQKLLAYALTVIQAVGWVITGNFGNPWGAVVLGGEQLLLFGSQVPVFALITPQIILGGILIIMMDDLIQKWGFGSGTGIFIAAGVSQSIFVGLVSPLTQGQRLFWRAPGGEAQPVGALLQYFTTLEIGSLIPVISTLLVFAVVVYMQAMKVEIPLTFGNVRGFGQKWPLKFLYTSVMPVILVSALVTNLQIVGSSIAGQDGCSILGCFQGGQASTGLVSWLQPPTEAFTNVLGGSLVGLDVFHIVFYILVYALGSTLFSIFWMRTSGQDPDSVAEQIKDTGMKVPGFRKDKRVIKKVLNRYIPALTILSGFLVGLLAALANMTEAVGGGTGILLTVMILYRLYEQLAQKHMEELHPALKDFME